MKQNESNQDGVNNPQYQEHHPAADSNSAAPSDSGPFTPRLKHVQGGPILVSLDKTVIGECIQPEPAGMIFTVFFRLHEKFHDMGWKAVHIERSKKAHRIHAGKQFQRSLKILPAADGHGFFSDTRKKQPE